MRVFRSLWGFVFIVLISLIPLFALLHSGLPLTHDGQDHVARIANFYQSLSEGNLVPRWAGNLNWGYGHPILMFLYPLPSYAASLFHLFGFSLVDSTKLVFAFAFILGGLTTYLWLREFLGEMPAIAGSVVYNFAPYRFVDLYVRGAIGEHVAFIFPPLILYFFLKISKSSVFNRIYFTGACLSIAGLVLSHNALTLMFLPFIIFYALYLAWVNKKTRVFLIYQYIGSLFLGIFLSSFFLLPAFVEGRYTLRDIVTEGVALERFVDFKNLVSSPWNFGQSGQFSVEIGLILWIAFLSSPVILYKLWKNNRQNFAFYAFLLLYFVISIFIMLPESKFIWQNVTILQKFQFPWRFLSASVLAGAILTAYSISFIKNNKIRTIIAILIVVLSLFLTKNFWQPKDYLLKPESFYSGIYNGTTDTGESSPIWSIRFMEKKPKAPAEVIAGSASIRPIMRTSTHHRYEITAEFHSRIRENTLYFPGWRIYVDGKQYQGIQFQDPENRGLMTYYVPAGKHVVDVKFGDTILRTISNFISIAALALIFGIIFKTYKISNINN